MGPHLAFPMHIKASMPFHLTPTDTVEGRRMKGNAMHAVRTQCKVLDSSALRISTFTNKVRHLRITHNPFSFIAFVHLPCVLGLKGLQGIPTP